jgi:hypothetical protein
MPKSTPDKPLIVLAQYDSPEICFRIPFGVDLEDETQVANWWVKWGVLHVEYTTGEKIEIESAWQSETDFKWTDNIEITDADDVGVDFDEMIEEYNANLEKKITKFSESLAIKKIQRSKIYNFGLGLNLSIKRCGIELAN